MGYKYTEPKEDREVVWLRVTDTPGYYNNTAVRDIGKPFENLQIGDTTWAYKKDWEAYIKEDAVYLEGQIGRPAKRSRFSPISKPAKGSSVFDTTPIDVSGSITNGGWRFKTKEEFQAEGRWNAGWSTSGYPAKWNSSGAMNRYLGTEIPKQHWGSCEAGKDLYFDGWTFNSADYVRTTKSAPKTGKTTFRFLTKEEFIATGQMRDYHEGPTAWGPSMFPMMGQEIPEEYHSQCRSKSDIQSYRHPGIRSSWYIKSTEYKEVPIGTVTVISKPNTKVGWRFLTEEEHRAQGTWASSYGTVSGWGHGEMNHILGQPVPGDYISYCERGSSFHISGLPHQINYTYYKKISLPTSETKEAPKTKFVYRFKTEQEFRDTGRWDTWRDRPSGWSDSMKSKYMGKEIPSKYYDDHCRRAMGFSMDGCYFAGADYMQEEAKPGFLDTVIKAVTGQKAPAEIVSVSKPTPKKKIRVEDTSVIKV